MWIKTWYYLNKIIRNASLYIVLALFNFAASKYIILLIIRFFISDTDLTTHAIHWYVVYMDIVNGGKNRPERPENEVSINISGAYYCTRD